MRKRKNGRKTRNVLSPQDKAEAIRQVRSGMRTEKEAASHFNVHVTTMNRWIREAGPGGEVVKELHKNKDKRTYTDPIKHLAAQNKVMRKFMLENYSKEDLLDMVLTQRFKEA